MLILLSGAPAGHGEPPRSIQEPRWRVDFFDDFDTFNEDNWQDQILWVNNEDQCYLRGNQHNTREVSNGTLKLRVIDVGEKVECDNLDKFDKVHPPSRYVAGRIASKNHKEYVKGKWTARLRAAGNGQAGMFPAWWLLGARNDEPPVQEPDEDICWPMTGSGEIDIFEHYGSGGADHFTARIIHNLGDCGRGDWETYQNILETSLDEFHEYSVEWQDEDLVFRLDGKETVRLEGLGKLFPEPMFAILNYAKITADPMQHEWVMEVDWVKHEYLE